MPSDRAAHAAWRPAEAIAVFCPTDDEHAIADRIWDLGHLAEERGLDFVSEVRRGIRHSFAERHAVDGNRLGPDAVVLAVGGSMTEGIHRE